MERYRVFDPQELKLRYTCQCGTEFTLNPNVDLKCTTEGKRYCAACSAEVPSLHSVVTKFHDFLSVTMALPKDGSAVHLVAQEHRKAD
jgi:hypothetical protein